MRTPFMSICAPPTRRRPRLPFSGALSGMSVDTGRLTSDNNATLGYLARLAAVRESGAALPPFVLRLLSVYKTYKHDPEVAIYTTEAVMALLDGKNSTDHPYLYPMDNIRRDITDEEPPDDIALVSTEGAARYLRRNLLHKEEEPDPHRPGETWLVGRPKHYAFEQGVPEDVQVTPLIPWMGREISRMLKAMRKNRSVNTYGQVTTGDSTRLFKNQHVGLPKGRYDLSDVEKAFRHNLHEMANSATMQNVLDWYVQTGPDAAEDDVLFDEDGKRHELKKRRQPGVTWGEDLDISRYSWVDVRRNAEEWHRVDAERTDLYRAMQKAKARKQPRGTIVAEAENGWYVEELDSRDKMVMEADALGHCIRGSNYWDAVVRGVQRHVSFRERNDTASEVLGEDVYQPRYTVHLDHVDRGWRVNQIKGFQNQPPPHGWGGVALEHDEAVEHCSMIRGVLSEIDPRFETEHDWVKCRRVLDEEHRRQEAARRGEGEEG